MEAAVSVALGRMLNWWRIQPVDSTTTFHVIADIQCQLDWSVGYSPLLTPKQPLMDIRRDDSYLAKPRLGLFEVADGYRCFADEPKLKIIRNFLKTPHKSANQRSYVFEVQKKSLPLHLHDFFAEICE